MIPGEMLIGTSLRIRGLKLSVEKGSTVIGEDLTADGLDIEADVLTEAELDKDGDVWWLLLGVVDRAGVIWVGWVSGELIEEGGGAGGQEVDGNTGTSWDPKFLGGIEEFRGELITKDLFVDGDVTGEIMTSEVQSGLTADGGGSMGNWSKSNQSWGGCDWGEEIGTECWGRANRIWNSWTLSSTSKRLPLVDPLQSLLSLPERTLVLRMRILLNLKEMKSRTDCLSTQLEKSSLILFTNEEAFLVSDSKEIFSREKEVLESVDFTDSFKQESSLEQLDWMENLIRKPLGMTLCRRQVERKETLAVIFAKDITILIKRNFNLCSSNMTTFLL
jgi:hypothetical protein